MKKNHNNTIMMLNNIKNPQDKVDITGFLRAFDDEVYDDYIDEIFGNSNKSIVVLDEEDDS